MLRADILFFDSNPIGRILTRFSKDMTVLDLICPPICVLITYGLFRTIAVTISICVINYYCLIPLAIAIGVLILILKKSQMALIETQRLDSIVRGPIHSLFAMVVSGLITIRAYDQVPFFQKSYMKETEMSANVTFTYTTANRWLGMRFDSVVLIVSLSCAILAMSLRDTFNGSLLIYSLQVISDLAVFFSISMRSIVEMQNYMTSF